MLAAWPPCRLCLRLPSDGSGTRAGSMTWDAPQIVTGLLCLWSFPLGPSLVTGLTVTLHVQWGHVLPGREVGVQGLLQPVRGLS